MLIYHTKVYAQTGSLGIVEPCLGNFVLGLRSLLRVKGCFQTSGTFADILSFREVSWSSGGFEMSLMPYKGSNGMFIMGDYIKIES
jgi:hypothetical protein